MAQRQRHADAPLAIDAFGEGGFRIAGDRHEGSIQLFAGQALAWPHGNEAQAKELTADDFAIFIDAATRPDVVVRGVGARMRHPAPEVRALFREAGIGLEVADTPTACRIYNIIANEARRVGAALIAV